MADVIRDGVAQVAAGGAWSGPLPARIPVSIDSRRTLPGDTFFALAGSRADGHAFVDAAFAAGACAAVVRRGKAAGARGPCIEVDDPLRALQRLAGWWRSAVLPLVVGITGSNGKTVVKDVLHALVAHRYAVARSPGSYNSAVGVPLSLLSMPLGTELALVECGVSEPGDMAVLAAMVRPTHGLLTNVGLAHIGAFGSREATAVEKARLFAGMEGWLVAPAADAAVELALAGFSGRRVGLGSVVSFADPSPDGDGVVATLVAPDGAHRTRLPTRSPELQADLVAAATAAHLLGVPASDIAGALPDVDLGPTRMEVWRTPQGVTLINDSTSADPISVAAALRAEDALGERVGKRIFVFGGMTGLGHREAHEHRLIGELAARQGVTHLVLPDVEPVAATETGFRAAGGKEVLRVVPEAIGATLRSILEPGDTVLVKGPRRERMDAVARAVWESVASKRLLVHLGAIAENVAVFRRAAGVPILAMLKAWAYGTELGRVAVWLQRSGVDWIGVATPDEGAVVRRAGVHLPVLVTTLDPAEIDKVVRYRLTPVVYGVALQKALVTACRRAGTTLDVHLKVDTGFGRLGVLPGAVRELVRRTLDSGVLRPTGLMTHLSCADDPAMDDFTRAQLAAFSDAESVARDEGMTSFLRHAANSAAAVRFPEARFDLVRIGIGLYGVYPSPAVAQEVQLQLAVALVGRLIHVAEYPEGHAIGYAASYRVKAGGQRVGVVGLGYDDGVPWGLSGKGFVVVSGVRVPILGRVSMDSLSVDLTAVPDAAVGDEVLAFGAHEGSELRPEEVAATAGTIPWELLVKVDSRRVQRLFVGD